MASICGNCGTEMEQLNETQHYCPQCDETFAITKGKQIVAKKANVLDQIKEGFKKVNERLDTLEQEREQEGFLGF